MRVLSAALMLGAILLAARVAMAQCDIGATIAAIFAESGCDENRDGRSGAADVVAVLSNRPTPQPTPTVTATPTPTPTPAPTLRPCPSASLAVEVEDRSGSAGVMVQLSGERIEGECGARSLSERYDLTVSCAETSCAQLNALAPGLWRHSIRVLLPATGQLQHQRTLVLAGPAPARVRFTVFAAVLSVTSVQNDGTGSLRRALQLVDAAAKPALIQFDPRAFPAAVPTTIALQFALTTLATDDVTIDGTDPSGASGNRIIDAGALPIGAISITGARNRVIGLRLRNAGSNERDVLNISGSRADANVIERCIIETAASGDAVGVDGGAGKDFGESANVIRECEIYAASDKGVKATLGSYVRVEDCWVHDNANGGIQATLGGHVEARRNLVERNRGASAQNGLSVNSRDGGENTASSELRTHGNVVRANGANGISVRAFSVADVRDDYLAANGSSGIRVFNDVGPAASARVEGSAAVCNRVDGAVVANDSSADLGGGPLGSSGNNAFAQNNLRNGGANLRNATNLQVNAQNSQWEHCGTGAVCNETQIAAFDLSDHGARSVFSPAQAHRAQTPVIASVEPPGGVEGGYLRILGSGFNVIDGHFAEDRCADVSGRNRCVPLRGNCVQIGNVAAPVEAVTPTMLVVRWPFTCTEPVPLVVRVDQGANVAVSNTVTVCTNE